MVPAATSSVERWHACTVASPPAVSWPATLALIMDARWSFGDWVAAVVRRRSAQRNAGGAAEGLAITGRAGITFFRLPPPRPPDDLAEAVAASNDLARAQGWPVRLAYARLSERTRSRPGFVVHLLNPLLGCTTGASARVPRPSPGETVREWSEVCRLARLDGLVLDHAERANRELRQLLALWLSVAPPAPHLVFEYRSPDASILVTNASSPAEPTP